MWLETRLTLQAGWCLLGGPRSSITVRSYVWEVALQHDAGSAPGRGEPRNWPQWLCLGSLGVGGAAANVLPNADQLGGRRGRGLDGPLRAGTLLPPLSWPRSPKARGGQRAELGASSLSLQRTVGSVCSTWEVGVGGGNSRPQPFPLPLQAGWWLASVGRRQWAAKSKDCGPSHPQL